MKEIETLSSRVVYENKWMRVREDVIRRRNGSQGIYGVVEKTDFVVVVPIEGDSVYLVEQYRYPVKARHWEFPQGSWQDEEIDPEALARAELREETGLTADEFIRLGYLYMAYGHSPQGCNVFLARGLHQGSSDLDEEEAGLISRKFKIKDFVGMIERNEMKDATTTAVYGLMKAKGIAEFA